MYEPLRALDGASIPAVLVSLLAIAIAWVAWQPWPTAASGGIDPSWQAGLAMATEHDLAYGREFIFTYGPLGFLSQGPTMWYRGLAAWGLAYVIVLRALIAAVVLLGTRRCLGTAASILVAIVVASVAGSLAESSVLLAIVAWAIDRPLAGYRRAGVALVIGGFAGVEMLNKLSLGFPCVLLAVIFVICVGDRRLVTTLATLAGLLVAFLAAWVAVGQPLGAIPAYLHGSFSVSDGYGAAMWFNVPVFAWAFTVGFVMLVAGAWIAWTSAGPGRRLQRAGTALGWVVVWFFAWKDGMVREDTVHVPLFMESLLVAWFALRLRGREQRLALLAGAFVLVVAVVSAQIRAITGDIDPGRNVSAAVANVGDVIDGAHAARTIAAGRINVQELDGIDPGTVSRLRGHTVAVYPNEAALVWANRLDWRPLPVIQAYSAYTPYLDHRDATFLASARAPQRILLQPSASDIDERVLAFDEPQAMRTLLCRYRMLHAAARYAVLARGASRCSAPRLVRVESFKWGQNAPVPPPPGPHSFVYGDVSGVQIHGAQSLLSLLYKPRQEGVIINGQLQTPYRLIEANADDGLPLRARGPIEYRAPFALVPQASTIAFTGGHAPPSSRPITVRFYAVDY